MVIVVNFGDSNQRISDPPLLPVVRCLVTMVREWTLRLLRLRVLVRPILIGLVGCLPFFLPPSFALIVVGTTANWRIGCCRIDYSQDWYNTQYVVIPDLMLEAVVGDG